MIVPLIGSAFAEQHGCAAQSRRRDCSRPSAARWVGVGVCTRRRAQLDKLILAPKVSSPDSEWLMPWPADNLTDDHFTRFRHWAAWVAVSRRFSCVAHSLQN